MWLRCGKGFERRQWVGRSLAEFLNYGSHEATPDHSTLSITRKRLPPEVFDEVIQFVLKIADEKRLLGGRRSASIARRWKRMRP